MLSHSPVFKQGQEETNLKRNIDPHTEKLYQKEIKRLQAKNRKLQEELDFFKSYYEDYKTLSEKMKESSRRYEKTITELDEIKAEYKAWLDKCKNHMAVTP